MAIDPNVLAMMSPRFRPVAVMLDALPGGQRRAAFEEWCAGQPDGEEILRCVAEADPYGPPPPGYGFGDGDALDIRPPRRRGPRR